MVLSIEDEKSVEMALQLSKMTGKTLPGVIETALRELLERERRKGMADRVMAIGRQIAPNIDEPLLSTAHGDLLYDENGLPK
ncbi:hypothetical protein F183_A17950 [Bryobacterales bacterium F-183]|nr:hypothetical protein F183_A17950 [Bryobacterales bacterium F-183]